MSDSRCAKVQWLRFNGCQAEIEAAQVEFGAHLLFKRHKKKCCCLKLSVWSLNCLRRHDLLFLRVFIWYQSDNNTQRGCLSNRMFHDDRQVVGPPLSVGPPRSVPEAGWSTTHSRYVNKWEQWKHTLVKRKTRAWSHASKMSARSFGKSVRTRWRASPSSGWITSQMLAGYLVL